MNSTPGRPNRLESRISLCILAMLAVIAAAILLRQSNADMGRFGMQPADTGKGKTDLAALAPAQFEPLSDTEVYTADNLYEKINGKATLYLDSQFERLLAQRFANADNENQWMELFVYDMGGARDAFSVYSTQIRPEAQILPDMEFGYGTTNGLYLVTGRYYVEMVGSSESQELLGAMAEVARKIKTSLAAKNQETIPELSLLPRDNLVPNSAKLYLSDAFGFEGLTDTFVARYLCDGQTVTAFFSRRAEPKDARELGEKYFNFLIDSGATAKQTTSNTLQKINVRTADVYDTIEIVGVIGPFVAGIHGADDQSAAEKIAEALFAKLGRDADE
jgi:hypothetical protein